MTPERRAELRRELEYRSGTFWDDMRDLLDALDACERGVAPGPGATDGT